MERDRTYTFEEIAEQLGCDEHRARRVVAELRDLTVPNLAGLGEAIVPLSIEDDTVTLHGSLSFSTEHVLRLDRMQTIAAVLALRMRGVGWDDPLMTALCDAVTIDAPIEHLSHIIDVAPAPFSTATVEVLAQAALDGCCVEIVYGGGTRIIEPWVLLCEKDQHYEYAWCHLRDEPRMFRLDRIEEATLLPARRAMHPFEATDLHAYPQLESSPFTARLHFADPHAFDPREWTGARVIATTTPGVTIELPFSDPSWIARQVVAHLGEVTVLSPVTVREAVVEHATRVRALCGADR
jgi:proteasome accessory factor C